MMTARVVLLSGLALAWAGTTSCGESASTTPDAVGEDAGGEADVPPDDDADVEDVEPPDGADGDDDDGTTEVETIGDADADDGGPLGLPVGSPCTDGSECRDGAVPGECFEVLGPMVFPGGYCSALGCTSDDDCPGGAGQALCFGGGDRPGWCLDRCNPAAPDCRSGYNCIDVDGPGPMSAGCLPLCLDNDDCPPGQTCDRSSEMPVCRAGAGAPNGEACATPGDCASGSSCAPERGGMFGGWPGGFCTQQCLIDADCTNGGVCALRCEDENRTDGDDCDDDGTPGLDDDAEGTCLAGCTPADPAACPRTGWSCKAVGENPDGAVNACAPDCSESGACTTPGWECDPSAGLGSHEYGPGRCQPRFDGAQLGAACTLTSGCTGGFCLAEAFAGYPGGLCVEECTGGPGADRCPGTALCLAETGRPGVCMGLCNPSAPACRDAWECARMEMIWICRPDCTRNDQCDYGCCSSAYPGYCDPSRSTCL
ncbi:MAG: hypothetical protein QME96_00330 [Myxococcota bacterium]|nr:hypothetical protein [Myxococcota bacterium]